MKKNFKKIINQIEKVRENNNTNWMNILRLAFKAYPNEAKKIISKIHENDTQNTKLAKQLERLSIK